jgi:hypothetical protein
MHVKVGSVKLGERRKGNEHFETKFEKLKVGKENLKLLKRKKLPAENHRKIKSSHEKKKHCRKKGGV